MTLQEALKVNEKVRQNFWNSYMYIRYESNDFCGGKFFNERGQQITLSPDSYLADTWEPFKESCAHEPNEYDLNLAIEGGPFDVSLGAFNIRKISTSKSSLFGNDCKHCGAKIKAKEWIEA